MPGRAMAGVWSRCWVWAYARLGVGTVNERADHEGLSLGYRLLYRIKMIGLSVFGPAQLDDRDDPRSRLRRERAAKVEAARQQRLKG